MKTRWKAFILSFLVVPGLGQIVVGHVKRGLAFMGALFLLFLILLIKLFIDLSSVINTLNTTGQKITLIDFYEEIEKLNMKFWIIGFVVLILFWIVGAVDAYRLGSKIEKQQERP